MSNRHVEDDHQKAFFEWLKLTQPEIYNLTLAIPNGGRRDIAEARRLKQQGVKSGVPDIFVAVPMRYRREVPQPKLVKVNKDGTEEDVPRETIQWQEYFYGGLWIEMKRPGKPVAKTTANQDVWLAALRGSGYCTAVAYGWEDAAAKLVEYLNLWQIT